MDYHDPLLTSTIEERPPSNPALSALKRVVWIVITVLVILSLLLSMLVPIIQRRNPRPNPENEVQAHWISNQYSVISVQSLANIQYQIPTL